MDFNFKAAAQEVVGGSFILEGREKKDVSAVIAAYPNGMTITGADLLEKDGSTFSALTIAEDPTIYFFGGKSLTDIVKKWSAAYDGDHETMSADLIKKGGLRVKLSRTKTKAGRDFTSVEIL